MNLSILEQIHIIQRSKLFSFLVTKEYSLLSMALSGLLAHEDVLTLASSCSISTDMVSNILSWVELLSRGVVSDL